MIKFWAWNTARKQDTTKYLNASIDAAAMSDVVLRPSK